MDQPLVPMQPMSLAERFARSTEDELLNMDVAVDDIRQKRNALLSTIMSGVTAESIVNVDTNGAQLAALALRGLSDAEKSYIATANVKLKVAEQQSNSKAAEAIVTMLSQGFKVGEIPADYVPGEIDETMMAEFAADIKPGELREDNRDYSDPV